ncbi:MAG: lipid-A-disaccharide synthase N-terminal domain-containing protein, partial [Phycisphaerales bacterium]|nr:lipid-A-disaccharide synthase N-terminal domain-containing protein [Phycisphaerales bacterium]
EPLLAMVALIAVGLALVWKPRVGFELETGAWAHAVEIAGVKGVIVTSVGADDVHTHRLLLRDGTDLVWQESEIEAVFPGLVARLNAGPEPTLFRIFNITSWWSMTWIVIGLGGQVAFFGRMFIQWIVSERKQSSVVPPLFWWLSLIGGVSLFVYFVWRRDMVGVLGQSSGVVIYARNLRLIRKERRRAHLRNGAD